MYVCIHTYGIYAYMHTNTYTHTQSVIINFINLNQRAIPDDMNTHTSGVTIRLDPAQLNVLKPHTYIHTYKRTHTHIRRDYSSRPRTAKRAQNPRTRKGATRQAFCRKSRGLSLSFSGKSRGRGSGGKWRERRVQTRGSQSVGCIEIPEEVCWCVCVLLCVLLYVLLYVCGFVSMCDRRYVCVCVDMLVGMYVCIIVHVCVCMYECMTVRAWVLGMYVDTMVRTYVCMYVSSCMCV